MEGRRDIIGSSSPMKVDDLMFKRYRKAWGQFGEAIGHTITLLGPPDTTGTRFEQNGEGDQAPTRNWTHELMGNKA